LESYIAGARNIYFSPAGIFYNTAIEYLPNQDDININILYNIWRLSSTKELVLSESKSFNKCALFGGINYNTSVSTLAKQSPTYTVEEGMNEQVSLDSLDLRAASISGGFSYLDGTMEEVGNISMMCLESDIKVDMYCDNEGSETTFKNLSGSDINVLHIATHGFYYANKSIGRKLSLDKLFHHLSCNNHNEYFEPINEDKMLTRSGLILAGANNILKRIQLPQGIEDGILYANEVANLNLNKTNLLVLSACQSGLGDIGSSEGVFGLQRGFKLAGARTIVMSLWKVHDKATQILMSEMYKNIGAGQSIREALSNAQLTLRMVEGGYFDKPEYWAGFIILDGLN
jgi:CHAT domain-containing protein